jgi:hypothetical protein
VTDLVSVTRILNEDDIVEAFVRHNSRHFNSMIFLDNGSTDGTLEILRALKAEGLPIAVFQSQSLSFNEVAELNWLYRMVAQVQRADWIAPLDTDEFVMLDGETGLATLLEKQKHQAVMVDLVNFYETPEDDATELVVPLRQRWRQTAPASTSKMILRAGLGTRLIIDAGNHGGLLDGKALPTVALPGVSLAHYPRRNGFQNVQKCAIGWLKVLAGGQTEISSGHAAHYQVPFEALRDDAAALIGNPLYLRPGVDRTIMIEAPLRYEGGALRYTAAHDGAYKALEVGLRYVEQLARQHGRLVDESPEARRLVETRNSVRKFLF